jgi:hypothetical protein
MNMPVYDVSEEADSGDIDDLTMVLPTFWVSMEGDWEDDAGFLTPTLSHLPAGMEVIVPINVEGSTEGDENLDMLGNMTINFTTAESATDFTLLVTVLDDNPESDISENPPNDIPAFFIDVTIIGDFPGLTPDTEAFFENPPELTFTLTEEWAIEQDTDRDGNNVPIVGLFLLDEGDGSWLELTSELESPLSAVDDTYTYTAILPHFSTYVVTAGETGESSGPAEESGGEGVGSGRTTLVRNVAESLLVTALVEDYGEGIARDIVDSLSVLDRQSPLHERVISVQNVTVTVGLGDIQAAAFGTAEATLTFEITNKNGETEEILLRYFYNDPVTGQKAYDERQTVTIGPHDTITHFVDIPFSSSGVFDVMIEVESDDGTIASTDIVIDIPWLEVYIFVLTVVIVGVVSAPVAIVAYALRQGLLPRNAGGRPEDIALALIQAAIAAGVWIMRALARRRRSGAVRHPADGIAERRTSLYAIARKVGRILAAGIGRASRFFWLIARRRRSKEEEEAVERLLRNRRPGEQIIGALKRAFKFIFRRRA